MGEWLPKEQEVKKKLIPCSVCGEEIEEGTRNMSILQWRSKPIVSCFVQNTKLFVGKSIEYTKISL